ncbi:hypothetical protein KY285_012201 [Solanum tuberosum]|nr:hypothetical protein KY289_010775 [Solanum tuberosum]KAH0736494.1 hypothetical protein KY285_012201 [Solanum tuberosum]
MPLIGMGTAPSLPQHDELVSTLIDAIEIGYRHFDTAAVYGSEEALGQAVGETLQCGLIKSREQVFITSKLWCTETHRDLVLPALKRTLGRLKMDYLDLYLIHLPVTMKKKVEMHVACRQEKMLEYCKEKGIHVALRWVYEQGASAIVKSFNKDRMKENLQILDWELSNEEIAQIQEIPPCTGFKVDMVLVHPNGPYKFSHQFWDGEI